MSQLNGNGIPTNKTYGQVGDIYTDNNTNKKYKCVLAFDGWIVDACGNHYKCAIGGSWVTLGELMTRGIPQPSEKDANKVLCGDMTWKDAQNITDEHINTLIDKKLGVIENGTY